MESKLLRSGATIIWGDNWESSPLPSKALLLSLFPDPSVASVAFEDRGLVASVGDPSADDDFFMEILVNQDRCEIGGNGFERSLKGLEILCKFFMGAPQKDSPQRGVGIGFNVALEIGDLPGRAGEWLGRKFVRPGMPSFRDDHFLTATHIQFQMGESPTPDYPLMDCTLEPRAGKPSALFALLVQANRATPEWPNPEDLIGNFRDFALNRAPASVMKHLGLDSSQS